MIVRMKKTTLLCLASERDASLEALRALGVLHVVPIAPPASGDLDALRAELADAQSTQALLRAAARADRRKPSERAAASSPAATGGAEVVSRARDLTQRRRALEERRDALRAEEAQAAPFGDFDPAAARALTAKGLSVRLFFVPAKDAPAAPEGMSLFTIREEPAGRYVAAVSRAPFEYAAREWPLPARALGAVRAELAAATAELAATERQLLDLAHAGDAPLAAHIETITARATFQGVKDGMGASGAVAYLSGFCPADAVEPLRQAAAAHGWGLLIEEPADSDRVPTLIRNPRWIRPIEALFDMIRILPGYREVDVSAPFLFFLTIFFAMIIGDAGYGLIFLTLTLLARHKMKTAPAGPFILMTVFSVATIVWGILSGAYFGLDPLPAALKPFQDRIPLTAWLAERQNIMGLCLLIGSIHLSLAHLWNAIRAINSLRALAQLGWIALVWTMFFLARAMMFGLAFPKLYVPIAIAGLVAIVLFMTPPNKLKEEWINHAMLPLSVMSAFGDVLSYLRLYALGVAGFKVAGAFNLLAGGLGFDHVLTGLLAALILFASHALNVALSAMSVLVHGIRLNALEFSMHLGLEWTGFEYRPFRRN
jgi:V/A-type H+-transporting ATPase subunit I